MIKKIINEILFEMTLEAAKRSTNGLLRQAVDTLSFDYNANQYNDSANLISQIDVRLNCLQNQINMRGGFVFLKEAQEIISLYIMKDSISVKKNKHFISGFNDMNGILK